MPLAVSGKWLTNACTLRAPCSRRSAAAALSVPPVAVMSSIMITSQSVTSPTTLNASTVESPVRCFATIASPVPSLRL